MRAPYSLSRCGSSHQRGGMDRHRGDAWQAPGKAVAGAWHRAVQACCSGWGGARRLTSPRRSPNCVRPMSISKDAALAALAKVIAPDFQRSLTELDRVRAVAIE